MGEKQIHNPVAEVVSLLDENPEISVQMDRIGETTVTVHDEETLGNSYKVRLSERNTDIKNEQVIVLSVTYNPAENHIPTFSFAFNSTGEMALEPGWETNNVTEVLQEDQIVTLLGKVLAGVDILGKYLELSDQEKFALSPFMGRVYSHMQDNAPTYIMLPGDFSTLQPVYNSNLLSMVQERVRAYLDTKGAVAD